MRWAGLVAREGRREMHTGFGGKSGRPSPLGSPRSRKKYDTKNDVKRYYRMMQVGLIWI